jgi:hypothetical protein
MLIRGDRRLHLLGYHDPGPPRRVDQGRRRRMRRAQPVDRGKQGMKRSSMTGGWQIAHKGDKAPNQASQRWHVERTNAWHNAFNRLQAATSAARR